MKNIIKHIKYYSYFFYLIISVNAAFTSIDIEQYFKDQEGFLKTVLENPGLRESECNQLRLKEISLVYYKHKKESFQSFSSNKIPVYFLEDIDNEIFQNLALTLQQNFSFLEENMDQACGRVKALFKKSSPIYSSAFRLNKKYVLTLTSGVFYAFTPAEDIIFYTYSEEKKRHVKSIPVLNIFVEKDYFKNVLSLQNDYNYSILEIEEIDEEKVSISDIESSFKTECLTEVFKEKKEEETYILLAFKKTNPLRKSFSIVKEAGLLKGDSIPSGAAGGPIFIQGLEKVYTFWGLCNRKTTQNIVNVIPFSTMLSRIFPKDQALQAINLLDNDTGACEAIAEALPAAESLQF